MNSQHSIHVGVATTLHENKTKKQSEYLKGRILHCFGPVILMGIRQTDPSKLMTGHRMSLGINSVFLTYSYKVGE